MQFKKKKQLNIITFFIQFEKKKKLNIITTFMNLS